MNIARIVSIAFVFIFVFAGAALGNAPVPIQRQAPEPFVLPSGETHWYEAVHLPEGGVGWARCRALAEQAGGYLATLHSDGENEFVFNLVKDEKYWFRQDAASRRAVVGPFIGGFKPEGGRGWEWVSGEKWAYAEWGRSGPPSRFVGGGVLAYLGTDAPAKGWGALPHEFDSSAETSEGKVCGFVIEYDKKPTRLSRGKKKTGRTMWFSRFPVLLYKPN